MAYSDEGIMGHFRERVAFEPGCGGEKEFGGWDKQADQLCRLGQSMTLWPEREEVGYALDKGAGIQL